MTVTATATVDVLVGDSFPTLPTGVRIRRTIVYRETVQETESGLELRIKHWTGPKYRYEFEFKLRTATTPSETSTFVDFIEAHSGPHSSFWFTDPFDSVQRRVRIVDSEIEMERIATYMWATGSVEMITTNAQSTDGSLDSGGLY